MLYQVYKEIFFKNASQAVRISSFNSYSNNFYIIQLWF